jgi:hypothetical protein
MREPSDKFPPRINKFVEDLTPYKFHFGRYFSVYGRNRKEQDASHKILPFCLLNWVLFLEDTLSIRQGSARYTSKYFSDGRHPRRSLLGNHSILCDWKPIPRFRFCRSLCTKLLERLSSLDSIIDQQILFSSFSPSWQLQ